MTRQNKRSSLNILETQLLDKPQPPVSLPSWYSVAVYSRTLPHLASVPQPPNVTALLV